MCYNTNSFALLFFLERGVVRPWWQILYKLMLKWKEVSEGDRSQKTCKVGVSGDYMFVVGKVVVGPYGCLIAPYALSSLRINLPAIGVKESEE